MRLVMEKPTISPGDPPIMLDSTVQNALPHADFRQGSSVASSPSQAFELEAQWSLGQIHFVPRLRCHPISLKEKSQKPV